MILGLLHLHATGVIVVSFYGEETVPERSWVDFPKAPNWKLAVSNPANSLVTSHPGT